MAAPRVTPGRRGGFPGRERTGGRAGDAQDPPGGVPGCDRTFAVLRVVGAWWVGLFGSSLVGVSGCRLMVPGRVRVWPGPRWGSGHEDEKVIRHVTSPGPRCGGMVPAARREAAQLAPDPRCGGGMVPGRVLARVPGLRRPAGGARSSSSPRRTSARAALSAGGVRSALRAFRARPCANESRRSRVLVARCLRVRALASAWVLLRSAGPAVLRCWSARRAPSACGARGAGERMPLRRRASSVPRGRT